MTVLVGASTEGAVGYSVAVPQSLAYSTRDFVGKSIELYIHTHVREDALDLYGFLTRLEKELFLTLLSVNGIGPKGAMGILSKVEPEQLIQAILDGDQDSLVQIPGIGKKTAERVVVELRDSVRKKVEAGAWRGRSGGVTAASAHAKASRAVGASAIYQDAKAALIHLGYRDQQITPLLNRVMEESSPPPARVEDLIRTALQQLV